MKALRYHTTGKPQEVLRLDEVPTPTPRAGEVRIRITHRSVNPADLHTMLGRYGKTPALPAVGGHEGVGVVDAVGPQVDQLEVGQRVVPMGIDGTWQEYITADTNRCFLVPDDVHDEAAAQLFVNPLTALLLLDELDLPGGAWLLQTAGTSQVGRLVVQLARNRGLRTISLVRREDAIAELRELGADEVLVVNEDFDSEGLKTRIQELTGDRGADGAVDAVAGETGTAVASCLADQATMLVYGGLSGKPLALPAGELIFNRIGVRGFWRTRWFETHPLPETRKRLGALALAIAGGELQLPVEATYDLADFQKAIEHSRRPGTRGKVLLTG